MNARPRVVVGHVVGWCLVIFFVVLLTVIFSFLGTIICAALAGMMMGSARLSRWNCVLGSLIFPAVVSTVLRFSRAELGDRQLLLVSLLCFGIFWLIYGVMRALVSQEAASKDPGCLAVNSRTNISVDNAIQTSVTVAEEVPGTSELRLESLQGTWFAGSGIKDQTNPGKVLEIHDQIAVLSVLDANGGISSKAQGQLQLTRTA